MKRRQFIKYATLGIGAGLGVGMAPDLIEQVAAVVAPEKCKADYRG